MISRTISPAGTRMRRRAPFEALHSKINERGERKRGVVLWPDKLPSNGTRRVMLRLSSALDRRLSAATTGTAHANLAATSNSGSALTPKIQRITALTIRPFDSPCLRNQFPRSSDDLRSILNSNSIAGRAVIQGFPNTEATFLG